MKRILAGVACVVLSLPCGVLAATEGGYAVLVSRSTHRSADWQPVVETLVRKHGATVLVYEREIAECLDALKRQFPRYTCFVATPAEATRAFVAEVHALARTLDDDPYADTLWGILTGYDAANALAIASHAEPLVVRKAASGTEIALECCQEGFWYDELVQNKMVRKLPGGAPGQHRAPDDTTEPLVAALNEYQADLFVTSGHATERDWQIGYRFRSGQFRSENGRLYGLDTAGRRHPIDSPNPKVYLPIGNCLMGHIDGGDAMALAWMNSAGVKQMVGYTIPTAYGYGGWGCLDYFLEQPGRYTFAEAFFANHHALVHRLSAADLPERDRRGTQGDRDTVAFYGDPAWVARMAPGKLAYAQTLTVGDGIYTLEIQPNLGASSFAPVNTNGSQRGGRPFVQFLPHRIQDVRVIEGADLQPVIADDFVLIPNPGICDPGRAYRIVFRATEQPPSAR